MRQFNVTVYAYSIECFEEDKISRVDYTALKEGRETLLYRVIISTKRGKVNSGRDRGAAYCHYHAKNIDVDYGFVVSG